MLTSRSCQAEISNEIESILSRIEAGVSIEIMSNLELLKQLPMDSTSLGVLKDRQVNNNTYAELESASSNMCFVLHSKKVQLLNAN